VKDFVFFPFLNPWQKVRLGLGIIYSSQIKDASKLDKIFVKQWLTKVFGRRVYEAIWDPLLRSKLGASSRKTSAAFIWTTINRLYAARKTLQKKERMGYVAGGYRTIIEAAERKLVELGVKIIKAESIDVLDLPGREHRSGTLRVIGSKETRTFDRVLLTMACPEVERIVSVRKEKPYWKRVKEIGYLGVVCVMLILSRRLSSYYVVNLLERGLPFTGIIELTNVVDQSTFGGRHIVYLPKYVLADDAIVTEEDEPILRDFVSGLKTVYPELTDGEILHKVVFRERYVQPLQELHAIEKALGFQTPVDGLYLCNTSMIQNSTVNNNWAVCLARNATANIIEDVK
jgi:protoporphyrinogen oxidase